MHDFQSGTGIRYQQCTQLPSGMFPSVNSTSPNVQYPKQNVIKCTISQVEPYQMYNIPNRTLSNVQYPKQNVIKCTISQVERYQINNIPNRTLPKCTIFQVRCPNTIKNVRHLFCFSNYWRLGFNLSANTYLRKCRLGICQMGNAKVVVIIIY